MLEQFLSLLSTEILKVLHLGSDLLTTIHVLALVPTQHPTEFRQKHQN